jgi:hypothetical protein
MGIDQWTANENANQTHPNIQKRVKLIQIIKNLNNCKNTLEQLGSKILIQNPNSKSKSNSIHNSNGGILS